MLHSSRFRSFLFVFYAIYVCSEVILLQNSCIIFPTVALFVLYSSLFSASLNPSKRNGLTVRNIGKNSIRFLLCWFGIIVNCPWPPTLPSPLLRLFLSYAYWVHFFWESLQNVGLLMEKHLKRNKSSTFYWYIMFY